MKRIIVVASIVICIGVTGASVVGAYYFYRQYRMVVGDSKMAEEVQTKMILDKIASVMDLPPEKPTIVTVTDREKLQNQDFFKKALNGDKIIIYETAKRVILYRPSTGRVVDVAPLVFNNPELPVIALPTLTITPTITPTIPASPSGILK